MTIHFRPEIGTHTACGIRISGKILATEAKEKVTCNNCLRTMKAMEK